MADLSKIRKQLEDLVRQQQDRKAQEEQIRQAKNEEDRAKVMAGIGQNLGQVFEPYLNKIQETSNLSAQELKRIISESVKVEVPGIDTTPIADAVMSAISGVQIPAPRVSVSVPPIKVPDIVMPETMNVQGWVNLMGYDRGMLNNPLPVQLRDASGNPVRFDLLGGSVTGPVGITDSQLRNQSLLIDQVSGASFSVSIQGASGSVGAALVDSSGIQYSGSNPLPVTFTGSSSTSVSLVNSDGTYYNSDNPLPITGSISTTPGSTFFASDAILSVNVIQSVGNATVVGGGYQDNALRVVNATDAITSVRIDSSSASVATNIVDSSGVAYTTSNPVPVGDAGGSLTVDGTVAVSGITNSVASSLVDSSGVQYSGSNPLPVAISSDAIILSDTTDTIGVLQVSGSVDSVNLLQVNGNTVVVGTGYQDNALRVVHATDAITSVNNVQWNGNTITVGTGYQDNALRVVEATDSVNSVNLMLTRGSSTVVGTGYQDNALRIVHATDAIVSVRVDSSSASVAANIVDSSGVAYSGSNPLPISWVSGAGNSTVVVGPVASDVADAGNAPLKMGGIARTANPTAVAAGDMVSMTMDDLGRQVTRPVQVRDLISTARVALSTGTETTLIAAVAGSYLDCVAIMCANNSDAAVSLDVRAVTAGNIVQTIQVPANGTAGWAPPIPWPQDATGNNWTIDMSDITGTTVTVSALFSKEI